ncbi:amyloid-beta precursor-like protein, partial [Gigantopelta aegis]|uniref:amyloid-beta precursor-like protein n=1 Tax=Gigantopelta aegis TaxID=1735272 RepID=UPI001B887B65
MECFQCLMKEWTAAQEHVAELKKTDPKSAIKLSNEITERFQRLYQANEQEDEAEKEQIVAFHQQHVQRDLNEHQRKTMEKYMNALQRKDAHKILKYLLAYLRTEEKDRMHTVNHYEHVKYTHPDETSRIRPHIIQHLHLIDQRINQSLQMLSRLPDLEKTIRPKIEKFLIKYKAIDATIKDVLLTPSKLETNVDSAPHDDDDTKKNH